MEFLVGTTLIVAVRADRIWAEPEQVNSRRLADSTRLAHRTVR